LNDGEVRLCVEDNGVGIPAEKLTGLLVESERIGLKNVSQRLISLYGEKYGLSLSSKLNEGTRAVIRIPFESWVSA
jgi:two-component system sensor histidine kinase YesM